jgi:hypothetical protein
MSPVIRLVPNLPAILVIVRRHRTGEVLVLANADEPWRLIFNVARALLPRHERRELLRALVA